MLAPAPLANQCHSADALQSQSSQCDERAWRDLWPPNAQQNFRFAQDFDILVSILLADIAHALGHTVFGT